MFIADPILDAVKGLVGGQEEEEEEAGRAAREAEEVARLIEAASREAAQEEAASALGDAKDTELRDRLHKLRGTSPSRPQPHVPTGKIVNLRCFFLCFRFLHNTFIQQEQI